jgi:alpha-tubulin suppressor-like RCC1 family protein
MKPVFYLRKFKMLKQFSKYNRVTRLLQHTFAAALRQASSCTHALALCATIGLAASAAQAQVTGGVLAWGAGTTKTSGRGTYNLGQSIVPSDALGGVTAIAGGYLHTIALKDGQVFAWGDNSDGQRTIPSGAQSGITAIASGANHNIALKNDGRVICWGANGYGQSLGTDRYGSQLIGWGVPGVRRGSYVRIRGSTLTGVAAIAGGDRHTIALTTAGAVLAWGSNGAGQRNIPTAATSGVTAIAGGGWHNIALKDGGVLAWGSNSRGQCTVPDAALSGVTAIAGGWVHTIALKEGRVLAWGAGTTLRRTVGEVEVNWGQSIVPAAALSGVTAIAGGDFHTIALTDSAVLAWGNNGQDQCTIPAAANSGVTAIAGGGYHTIALRVPAPIIARVTPPQGPLAGGTTITILGSDLGASPIVRVGGNLATSVTVTSPTSLTAITPPGSIAGSVSVDVTTLGGTSSRPNAFTYESPLCPADLNGDGVVNSLDTMIVMIAFGNCPPSPTTCPADLNADGVVNAADVTIVVNAYGDC